MDAFGSHARSMASLRPDNPIAETGVRSEFTCGGLASRVGKKRADVVHQPLDAVIVLGPWIAAGAAAYSGAKRVRAAVSRR